MDFFDKLSDFAKTATDKTSEAIKTASDRTGDMIEINKIKSKISATERNIAEEKANLGAYFYDRFATGMQMDENAGAICAAIKAAEDSIAEMQNTIASIKAENEAASRKAPAEPAAEAPRFCTGCGATLQPGVKFCGVCGTKAE